MGVLGGSLKRKERISARLGDILSHIFLASAALKRYEDEGRKTADLPLVDWSVKESLYQAENAINELLRNFPNRFIAGLMRGIIFPFGKAQKLPSDKLDHKV
ncbi:acyl-CoA dehydrogenase domain-containing protein, partial [Pseudomonas aeruginosa]|uniref:acyl-CoA dehydrogenase domain-containing protein n=1 Tax=Pseudomonas aeruginosa TaxID=287 RepID=UPI001C7CDA48